MNTSVYEDGGSMYRENECEEDPDYLILQRTLEIPGPGQVSLLNKEES